MPTHGCVHVYLLVKENLRNLWKEKLNYADYIILYIHVCAGNSLHSYTNTTHHVCLDKVGHRALRSLSEV